MQITEKIRKAILFALTELTEEEADRIAGLNGVSSATVYRNWKKIKSGQPVELNNIVLAIAELASSRKQEVLKTHKRYKQITKQLSAS